MEAEPSTRRSLLIRLRDLKDEGAWSEFTEVYDRLEAAGVPLKPDREQAWRDFAGWRVNYDTVLLTLAGLVMAPYAPWSSDRSPARHHRPPIVQRRQRWSG